MKLEIGSAPLGLCDDGLGFRPDAWDCVFSASGPSPLRVPQVGSSALLSRGGGSSRSHFFWIPEYIITERHDNGWLCKLTKQIFFPPGT